METKIVPPVAFIICVGSTLFRHSLVHTPSAWAGDEFGPNWHKLIYFIYLHIHSFLN